MTSEYWLFNYYHCHKLLRAADVSAAFCTASLWFNLSVKAVKSHFFGGEVLFTRASLMPFGSVLTLISSLCARRGGIGKSLLLLSVPRLDPTAEPEAVGALQSIPGPVWPLPWEPGAPPKHLHEGLQPRALNGHKDGLCFGKEPRCKCGSARFRNGFHAALTFVVAYKEAYSWRQNSLGGWKQCLGCSCFHPAWKVYRSPKERGGWWWWWYFFRNKTGDFFLEQAIGKLQTNTDTLSVQ